MQVWVRVCEEKVELAQSSGRWCQGFFLKQRDDAHREKHVFSGVFRVKKTS